MIEAFGRPKHSIVGPALPSMIVAAVLTAGCPARALDVGPKNIPLTVAGVAAGTLLSVLWFIRMLRRCGLRVRFGQA